MSRRSAEGLGDDPLLLGGLRLERLAPAVRPAAAPSASARAAATLASWVGDPDGWTRRPGQGRGLGSRLQLGSGAHQHGHGRERVVREGPVVEQCADGAPQAQRVERLDQPALGIRIGGRGRRRAGGRAASAPGCGPARRRTPAGAAPRHTAMPPMLPICMSTMTRSGDSSATNATTSGPEVTARTSTSGPLMTASISLRRVGASLATRMVCTDGTLSDPPCGAGNPPAAPCAAARAGRSPARVLRRRGGRPPAAARAARARPARRAGSGRPVPAPPAPPGPANAASSRAATAFSCGQVRLQRGSSAGRARAAAWAARAAVPEGRARSG